MSTEVTCYSELHTVHGILQAQHTERFRRLSVIHCFVYSWFEIHIRVDYFEALVREQPIMRLASNKSCKASTRSLQKKNISWKKIENLSG